MTTQGVDALGHPTPAALKAAGKTFVCCYLKNTTRAMVDGYLATGIKVVLIFETTGRRSLGGYASGVADANTAKALLHDLGAPAEVVVYFAEDDLDVSNAQLPVVLQYARGLYSILGVRAGWYGGLRTVEALLSQGLLKKFWQTYAWSHGSWAAGVALEQYLNGQSLAGTGVDFDRAMSTAFGAWLPSGTVSQPTSPSPIPIPAGDDMSAADVQAITDHFDAAMANYFASLSHGTKVDRVTSNGVGHDQILNAIRDLPELITNTINQALANKDVVATVDSAAITEAVLDGLAQRLAS